MTTGWIKVYRSLLKSPIFSSEKGLKIWVWCLLKATHKPHKQYCGRILVPLSPGQFIYGRNSAAQELGINPSTVRDWMKVLFDDKYIDIKPFNKFSVISILNWDDFQENDSKHDLKKKTKRQQKDTNKNVKNVKNNKISVLENVEKSVGNGSLPSFKDTYLSVVGGTRA